MTSSPRPHPRNLVARLWSSTAVRYLVVGGMAFLADIGLLWLAHDVIGIPLPIATPLAFLTSFVVTYTLQRLFAFKSDARVVASAARYTALVVFNTLATTGIVWLLSAATGNWLIGKVAAVAATTVWNYFVYRYWVFAPRKKESTDV